MASREMTAQEERYLMHAVGTDPLIASYLANQVNRGDQNFMRHAANLPVCSRCQAAALHHNTGVLCPSCGHFTPEKRLLVRDHIRRQLYK